MMDTSAQPNEIDTFIANHQANKSSTPQWVQKALKRKQSTAYQPSKASSTKPYLEKSLASSKNLIRYKRLPDINRENRSPVGIFDHRFSSNGKVLFSVGPDYTVQLYAINKSTGHKINEIKLDIPAYAGRFLQDETKILCTGKSRTYALTDLETQTTQTVRCRSVGCIDFSVLDVQPSSSVAAVGSTTAGIVTFMDTRTQRAIGTTRLNHPASAIAFDPLGKHFWTCAGGEVAIWDLRCLQRGVSSYNELRCKHADYGGVNITAFAASRDWYAVGSDVGIVNVYDAQKMRDFSGDQPKSAVDPHHTVLNLTTKVTTLTYSLDGVHLMYASNEVQNSVRMLNTKTFKTYKNFPAAVTKSLGRTLSAQFSPDGKLVTLGSSQGRIYTYEML